MPGRVDNNQLLDKAGWALALLTLLGVLAHGARPHHVTLQERIRSCRKNLCIQRVRAFLALVQATLIIFMLLTGFEVHGTYHLFGFGQAVNLHTISAWTLIGLWVFAIFWHFTTGEWKPVHPDAGQGDRHDQVLLGRHLHPCSAPVQSDQLKKHNPLQRLAYLVCCCSSGRCCGSRDGSTCSSVTGAVGVAVGRAALGGLRPHVRRVPDAHFPDLAPLSRDHRPHRVLADQGDDDGMGRGLTCSNKDEGTSDRRRSP